MIHIPSHEKKIHVSSHMKWKKYDQSARQTWHLSIQKTLYDRSNSIQNIWKSTFLAGSYYTRSITLCLYSHIRSRVFYFYICLIFFQYKPRQCKNWTVLVALENPFHIIANLVSVSLSNSAQVNMLFYDVALELLLFTTQNNFWIFHLNYREGNFV